MYINRLSKQEESDTMVLLLVVFPGIFICTLLALTNLALCVLYATSVVTTEPLIAIIMTGLTVAWFVKKATPPQCAPQKEIKLAGRHVLMSECECCICREGSADYVVRCEHRFHEACITRWACNGVLTCPLCRAAL